jgi:hypothetical protein
MLRKVQRTFDLEILVRVLAAASVLYVIAAAALHAGLAAASAHPLAGIGN